MNPSPEAKRVLQEYTWQRDREKRIEAVNRFIGRWVWLPIAIFFAWAMWAAFSFPR